METILEKLGRWPTRYMTIAEAVLLLNHHEQTLYKAVRAGRLPVVRTFGSLRIDPVRLAGWLKQRGAQADHESVLAKRPLFTEQPEKGSMPNIEVNDDGESEAEGVKVVRPVLVGNGNRFSSSQVTL